MEKIESSTPAPARARRLPAWVIGLAFIALIGFLVLIWLGLNRSQQGPIQVGDTVPPFTLTTFDGKQISTTDLAGKVIVVNFWASWCKPCEQEAAEVEQAWQMYKNTGKVAFLGVDWVDTEPEALGYVKKFKLSYPNGPDLRTAISQIFRLKGVPETYFIGRDGRLKYKKIGPFTSVSEIQMVIDGLLK